MGVRDKFKRLASLASLISLTNLIIKLILISKLDLVLTTKLFIERLIYRVLL